MADTRTRGTVFLVGAGPGDPGLLTVRAVELIATADALVCDAWVTPALLDRVHPGTEIHRVGEGGGEPAADEVAPLLIDLASRHRRVVRVKGGDPFTFGKGGREALALAEAGVRFEVVPGVTAGIAAPAYAGIPVTLSGVTSAVTLVKGCRDDADDGEPWESLARVEGTLVVYAGGGRLRRVVERLLRAGADPATPAAVVSWGTLPRQRTVVATLGDVVERSAGAESPALCVVGEVVRLRDRLSWFESRPLFGRRVMITRARAQAADLAEALEGLGAQVIAFPTIRIADPEDPEPLRRAVREADGYDWIVFTSVNAVERFWTEMRAQGRDTRTLAGVSICAIGPATAAALEMEGARADLVPREHVAEAVVEALAAEGELRGSRVLFPRAEVARAVIPEALRERGAEVADPVAYRTVPDGAGAEAVREPLRRGEIDLITFTSGSTARNFAALLGTEIGGARVACIGPVTAQVARELGFPVHVQAAEHTIPGLIGAIREHFEREAAAS